VESLTNIQVLEARLLQCRIVGENIGRKKEGGKELDKMRDRATKNGRKLHSSGPEKGIY